MDKDEIKRRLAQRIDDDDNFAQDVATAIKLEDDIWLAELIKSVIGYLLDLASSTWRAIKRTLGLA